MNSLNSRESPTNQFARQYSDLYDVIKPLINDLPDYRPRDAVERFSGSYPYGSNDAKWLSLLNELETISDKDFSGKSTDITLLERSQDDRYYVFINYPTAVRTFVEEYPALSWILTTIHQSWRLIMVGSGVTAKLSEVNPKLTAKDITSLFAEVRSVATLDVLLALYTTSTAAKKLLEQAANAPKKPSMMIRSVKHIASYAIIKRSLLSSGGGLHSYEDSKLPITKIDIELGLYSQQSSSLYNRSQNVMLLNNIMNEYILNNHESSVYWDFISDHLRTAKHPQKLRDIAIRMLTIGKDSNYLSVGSLDVFLHGIVTNNQEEIVNSMKIMDKDNQDIIANFLDHILADANETIRDLVISYFLPHKIREQNRVNAFTYASDNYLISVWSTLKILPKIDAKLLQDLFRRGRRLVLISMANTRITNNKTQELHRTYCQQNYEEITRYFIAQDRTDLISLSTLTEIFVKSSNLYDITTLIELNDLLRPKSFISWTIIETLYTASQSKQRDDICEYLRHVAINFA